MANQARILAPRRGSKSTMANSTIVLANGEIFIEDDNGTKRIKVGDGITEYRNLGYSASIKYADIEGTPGVVTTSANGLTPQLPSSSSTAKYLRGDGTWHVPSNATYSVVTTAEDGLMSSVDKIKLDSYPDKGSDTSKYLRNDGTWAVPPNDNTTYGAATTASSGLMPPIGADTSKYLRNDGSWQTPFSSQWWY